jgi:hypothetical protein
LWVERMKAVGEFDRDLRFPILCQRRFLRHCVVSNPTPPSPHRNAVISLELLIDQVKSRRTVDKVFVSAKRDGKDDRWRRSDRCTRPRIAGIIRITLRGRAESVAPSISKRSSAG